MTIKIDDITENRIVLSDEISHCENCKKPMIRSWSPFSQINIPSFDVVIESHREDGVCSRCVEKGEYPKLCYVCAETKIYPQEFAYELKNYPEYSDDDTDYEYICIQCVAEKQYNVIEALADADEVIKIQHKEIQHKEKNCKLWFLK